MTISSPPARRRPVRSLHASDIAAAGRAAWIAARITAVVVVLRLIPTLTPVPRRTYHHGRRVR